VNYLRHVLRGIDYIEEHLEEDLEPGLVAAHARVSQWYFQRIFKGLTGETLKAYIRSRRLAHALSRLASSDAPILDISLSSGFESQAAFTRAFRDTFGVTPAKYRAIGNRNLFARKLRIDEEYIRHLQTSLSLEPELVRRPGMMLVGLETSFYGVASEKNDMGEKLPPLWEAFLSRLGEVKHSKPGLCYGGMRAVAGSEQLDYLAGIEVVRRGAVPEGMRLMTLSASTYALFTHRGHAKDLNATIDYIYGNWLLRSGRRHTHGHDLELYGADYVPDSKGSIIRYAIPVADP
jgi:AraC-like DNA-binding protein/predicted transcriptional regulator YdeE